MVFKSPSGDVKPNRSSINHGNHAGNEFLTHPSGNTKYCPGVIIRRNLTLPPTPPHPGVFGYLTGVSLVYLGYLMGVLGYLMGVLG